MKSKKTNEILLSILTASLAFACASNAYAEINERPKFDATYDDKVVLDYEWQISPDEYTGAEKRKYTFNKGLTVSPNVSSTGNAIYLSGNVDVDFELGNGSEMNLESSSGALNVNPNSKLTINGVNSNLYFGNKKWDEYNGAATIYMDEGSKLEINAGNLTTSGGAETNLKLFDNAQAKINLTGNFTSDAGGTAIAMENDCRNSDTSLSFTVFDTEGKKITGAFDNTGISLSAKYGRKKYIDEHWSIEPQAQLTLGYLDGARYTTSNGIHVSQSDPNSVLGRIGCNFMYDMDENNTVYLKANWLHQFAGNYGVTLTNGNDSLRIDNNDHDTWFEYGFGFACMIGKNKHLYADVERSTGGSLRKDWQWNAGMFWTF